MKQWMLPLLLISLLAITACNTSSHKKNNTTKVPILVMPSNRLGFQEITGYRNYKIVATHYRTDKKELRYVLANPKAFKALSQSRYPLPEGSIVVKIGWKVQNMQKFGPALEAGKIQRIEYMIKDSKRFSQNPGSWGYARFVKQNGKYRAWKKGTSSCISCHNTAGRTQDFLFSRYQKIY